MTQKQWKLLWKGGEIFWKCTTALGRTGVDVQQAPQNPFPDHQKSMCLPSMLRDRQENTIGKQSFHMLLPLNLIGKQSFHILLPLNLSGVKKEERRTLQEWLDLVDWRESRVRQQTARQHSSIWAYTKKQPNGAGKSVGSSGRGMRRNAKEDRDIKRPRDRYETLRAIVRQGGHATDESSAIQRALEDLGGSQDPAPMVLEQYYGMSQSGTNLYKYSRFSARVCFQRSGGQLPRQTGDTWRG